MSHDIYNMAPFEERYGVELQFVLLVDFLAWSFPNLSCSYLACWAGVPYLICITCALIETCAVCHLSLQILESTPISEIKNNQKNREFQKKYVYRPCENKDICRSSHIQSCPMTVILLTRSLFSFRHDAYRPQQLQLEFEHVRKSENWSEEKPWMILKQVNKSAMHQAAVFWEWNF